MKRRLKDTLLRLGWAGPLAKAWRWITQPGERERDRILAHDFRISRGQWSGWAAKTSIPATKTVWILSAVAAPWAYKLEGALSTALRLQGYEPVIVAPDHDPWRFRYHSLYGNRRFIDFRVHVAATMPAAEISLEPFATRRTAESLLELRVNNVDAGRIVLSNILYENKFSRFDPKAESTLAEIRQQVVAVDRNIRAAERLIAKARPDLCLVLEKGTSPMAELVGSLVVANLPVIQYLGSQNANGYVFKRFSYENRHSHPFSLSPESWEKAKRMPWDETRAKRLIRDLDEEYTSGRWFDRKLLHTGKSIKSAEDVKRQLGLDPSKKTAVIFSHVLWDATFFYGKGLFDDYETWLVETVKAALKNPSLNWVVKLHPDLVWKMKVERQTGALRDLKLLTDLLEGRPSHVKIVPPETDIDTFSFFGITDYCLTVRGTIGIEMACRGVPVLTAGTGRYSGLGFTTDCESIEAYRNAIATLQDRPPLSAVETELARRFAYALFKARPWSSKSFSFIRSDLESIHGALNHNLIPKLAQGQSVGNATDLMSFGRWVSGTDTDYLDESILSSVFTDTKGR